MVYERFRWETRGLANQANIVAGNKYRFTVLTSRMIRMEYSPDGAFEDRASQCFFYRDLPAVPFERKREGNTLILETDELVLQYQENAEFCEDTLQIKLKSFPGDTWHFGEKQDQLLGTARTLDWTNGWAELEDGLCSRNGYTLVDDSGTALLTEKGWFDIRHPNTRDYYFFGYGVNYLDCIRDFYKVTGAPSMLPAYALGNWWSRFHPYSQQEYCDLVERFEKENIPMSVAVIDIDWHTRPKDIRENVIDSPRYHPGWTGYSWNKELFPDHKAFLKTLKEHGLHTSLNLHPACGVGWHEDMYPQVAEACGIDPSTKKLVKFDCLDPEFMAHYFDILHHPHEQDGIDFWWMDWQQGKEYWWIHDEEHQPNKLECIDPLWLLNHLHTLDARKNGKRPMLFSRYSGLGSHRYAIGFSGDTVVSWKSYKYQPYFTANAANAGYGWWSHDIGGHYFGYRDDELTVRWMQYGVLSPINRLHSCENPFMRKEPWSLHPYMSDVAKQWLRLRYRLFPYLYTMNYRSHKELIPLVLPMYYTHPRKDGAYRCPNQYWFGSELIVSPITEKTDKYTFLAKAKVWLPEGKWIDVFSGLVYSGEKEIEVHRSLEQFPVFAKAGAIVPIEALAGNQLGKKENMELYVFPGADNSFTLYEDAGDTNAFENGQWAKTTIDLKWAENAKLTIHPACGDLSLIPEKRNWTLCFRGFNQPDQIKVHKNEQVIPVQFTYDPACATACVVLEGILPTDCVEIICTPQQNRQLLSDNHHAMDRIHDIIEHAQTPYLPKMALWDYVNSEKHNWVYGMIENPEHETYCNAIVELLDLYDNK